MSTKNTEKAPSQVSDGGTEPKEQISPEEAQALLKGANRQHFEGLGMPWAVVLGGNPEALMPQVVATVLNAGGSRPVWQWTEKDHEFFLMAWPQDQPCRAGIIVSGKKDEKLRPIDSCPILEGLPNNLLIETAHPWQAGVGANVGATMMEGRGPMWFYDPLYKRDATDLTPGVTQGISIAGLAFSIRKALLDEMTITKGPQYEMYAEQWLAEHPDKTRLDVPPLKIPMNGRHLIMPGRNFCEYQIRAKVERVDECSLEKMKMKILYLSFPFDDRDPLLVPLYCTEQVLRGYEPAVGEEIDAYIWLQGRVVDGYVEGGPETEGRDLSSVPEHKNPLQ